MMRSFVVLLLSFVFSAGLAQPDTAEWIRKFESWQSAWKKPKLHMLFSQQVFSPGETVWLKAWLLNEDLTPMEGKHLVVFNLVDAHGKAVVAANFLLEDGNGHNQVRLPDTLAPGIYLATAYIDWMRNFDPEVIFRRELRVVKTHEVARNAKTQMLASPEGGKLVWGVENRIGIWTNLPGSALELVDGAGSVLHQIAADKYGTARFAFTPLRAQRYTLRIAGSETRLALPAPEDGVSMQLSRQHPSGRVTVALVLPPGSRLTGEELVVMALARGKVWHSEVIIPGAGRSNITLDDLPNGVITACVLDNDGIQQAHRVFYHEANTGVRVGHSLAKTQFGTRDSVTVVITLSDSEGNPVEGEFSARVLNAGKFPARHRFPVMEFFLLPEIPDRLAADTARGDWIAALDNYLVCRPQEVPWDEILENVPARPRFGFSSALSASARVYFAGTGQPVPDHTVVSLYFQQTKWRYQTFTLGGKIKVTFPHFFGDDEIFLLAASKEGEVIENVGIQWDEHDSLNVPRPPSSRVTDSIDEYGIFAEKIRVIREAYATPAKAAEDDGNIHDFEARVASADVTINLEDYLTFPSMEELIREVIPSIMHRRQGGKSTVKVLLSNPMNAQGDPLYVVDGKMTANTGFFLSLDPAGLLAIKVVKDSRKLLPLGLLGRNGIVIVTTKQGDLREPHFAANRVSGLSAPAAFVGTGVSEDPRTPDFRTTIFWNPSIRTDGHAKAQVEFVSSDDTGSIVLEVEGLTSGGEPFFERIPIRIVSGN